MYLCNASVGLSISGYVHVNFTDCNKHVVGVDQNGASGGLENNAMGAMQYTVAVFIVYGVAVLGVFGLGINHRRKQRRHNMDHEARNFLKNYDDVRRICEQRSRVGAVNALLRQLHNEPESRDDGNPDLSKARPSVNSLAFLPISLSIIEEDEPNFKIWNECDRKNSLSYDSQRTILNGPSNTDEKLKVHKCNKTRTTLGSSRRSYKWCKLCLATHGVTVSRNNCQCVTNKPLHEEISPAGSWNTPQSEDSKFMRTFSGDNVVESKL